MVGAPYDTPDAYLHYMAMTLRNLRAITYPSISLLRLSLFAKLCRPSSAPSTSWGNQAEIHIAAVTRHELRDQAGLAKGTLCEHQGCRGMSLLIMESMFKRAYTSTLFTPMCPLPATWCCCCWPPPGPSSAARHTSTPHTPTTTARPRPRPSAS